MDWNKLPGPLVQALLPFQREGVRFAVEKNGRCLIADEMGLGKTLQAISVACMYRDEWPLLVIVPSCVKFCWIEEFEKWLPDILPQEINLIQSGSDASAIANSPVSIITYGLLRIPSAKLVQETIRRRKFKVVICDESHYLRNTQTLSSKTIVPIIKMAKRRILLSGTPALARPVELYPQLDAICPGQFDSFWRFTERYCDPRFVNYGSLRKRNVNGASNLEELQQRMSAMLMIRREKREVLTELPPKQRQRVLFELKDSSLKKAIVKKFDALRQNIHKGKSTFQQLVASMDLQQDTNSDGETPNGEVPAPQAKEDDGLSVFRDVSTLYRISGEAKIGPVREYIEMLCENQDLKFLVFAYHHSMMDGVEQSLHAKKVRFVRIDGHTKSVDRQAGVSQFQSDPTTRVAILSILAAGVGLTLTAAKLVVFAELYWTPGVMLQCEDRAHRIGQTSPLSVHYLVAQNTMDEWVWASVCKKTVVTSTALSGKCQQLEHDEGHQYQIDVLSKADVWTPPETDQEETDVGKLIKSQRQPDQPSILDFISSPRHQDTNHSLSGKENSHDSNHRRGATKSVIGSHLTRIRHPRFASPVTKIKTANKQLIDCLIVLDSDEEEEFKPVRKKRKKFKKGSSFSKDELDRQGDNTSGNHINLSDFVPQNQFQKKKCDEQPDVSNDVIVREGEKEIENHLSLSDFVPNNEFHKEKCDRNSALLSQQEEDRMSLSGNDDLFNDKDSDSDSLPDVYLGQNWEQAKVQRCNTEIISDNKNSNEDQTSEKLSADAGKENLEVSFTLDANAANEFKSRKRKLSEQEVRPVSESSASFVTMKQNLSEGESTFPAILKGEEEYSKQCEPKTPLIRNAVLNSSEKELDCSNSDNEIRPNEISEPLNCDIKSKQSDNCPQNGTEVDKKPNSFKTPCKALKHSSKDTNQWPCSACTFLNHHILTKCEMCDSPKKISTRSCYKSLNELDPSESIHIAVDNVHDQSWSNSQSALDILNSIDKSNSYDNSVHSKPSAASSSNSDRNDDDNASSPNIHPEREKSNFENSEDVQRDTIANSNSVNDELNSVVLKDVENSDNEVESSSCDEDKLVDSDTNDDNYEIEDDYSDNDENIGLKEDGENCDESYSINDKHIEITHNNENYEIQNCCENEDDDDRIELELSEQHGSNGVKYSGCPTEEDKSNENENQIASSKENEDVTNNGDVVLDYDTCPFDELTNEDFDKIEDFLSLNQHKTGKDNTVHSKSSDIISICNKTNSVSSTISSVSSSSLRSSSITLSSSSTCSSTLSSKSSLSSSSTSTTTTAILGNVTSSSSSMSTSYTTFQFSVSLHTGRIYLHDEKGQSLKANFLPVDIEMGNMDKLPDFLKQPYHYQLLQKFVRQWMGLTATKRRVIAKQGLVFERPLQAYEAVRSVHGSTQRHLVKDNLSEATEKAESIQGHVRLIHHPNNNGVEGDDGRQIAGQGTAQVVTSDGVPLCLQCQKPYTNPLLPSGVISRPENAWQLRLCSRACMDKYWTLKHASYLREQIFEVERGICKRCNFDAQGFYNRMKCTKDVKQRADIVNQSPYHQLGPKARERLVTQVMQGQFWHADHIVPVWRGGGMCDLDNLRTLCTPCHTKVTKEQAGQRAVIRKLSSAASSGDITAFFKKS